MKQKQKEILVLSGIITGVLIGIYLMFSLYFMGHFFYGTTINGTDCTGMTVGQVASAYLMDKEEKSSLEKIKKKQFPLFWLSGFFNREEYFVKALTLPENGTFEALEESEKIEGEKESLPLERRKIIYNFGSVQEVLDYTIFKEWLLEQEENLHINEIKVQEYVEKLCAKYSTKALYRNFWGSDGELHRVAPGDYGWEIDKEAEIEFLMNHLLEEGETLREVAYLQTAASRESREWGNTYIEINLSKQHLWAYKDGELLIDTPVVTGNKSRGWDTPEGVYTVYGKARNRYLRGATYRTFVNYWMPVNGNIGIHDATWRKEFGGNIYETNGSHGCINVPKAAMDVIYPAFSVGTPVILYD